MPDQDSNLPASGQNPISQTLPSSENSSDVPPPPPPPSSLPANLVNQQTANVPQVLPESRSIPVVEEVFQAPIQIQSPVPLPAVPPAPDQPPAEQKKFNFPPLKYLLFGAGVLVVLGSIAFALNSFFFSAKIPEQTTLTYWGFEEKTVMDSLIREYEAKNPKVKIGYIKQAKEDYRERLVNSLAKNSGPDIFSYHNTWVPMLSTQLAPAPAAIFNSAEFANTFYPTASRDLVRGSSVFGVPLAIDGLGMYVNEAIFNENGKLIPNNWNDLLQTARELTQKDEEGRLTRSGVALGRTENVDHWEDILSLMLLQNKADLANPQGELAEDPVLFYISMARDEKIWDDTLPRSTQAFAKGLVAMYFGPSSRADEIKQLNPNLSFRIVPMPQLPKNAPDDPDVNYASYQVAGVWEKSKNSEEAWKFLKFMSEKTSFEKLYAAVSAARGYGNPYPRPDMAQPLENDPLVGAYLRQASTARSSYLSSNTYDGATGVNSRLSKIWKGMVDQIIQEGRDIKTLLPPVAESIREVLAAYSASQ